MSIKTIKERIALVAVATLITGVMSVFTAPTANATAFSTVTDGELVISTTASTDGDPSPGTGANGSDGSIGWIADTSATAQSTNSLGVIAEGQEVATATVLAGAKLQVMASNLSSSSVSIVVTGGTLTKVSVSSAALTGTLATDSTSYVGTIGTADNATIGGIFNVSAKAGETATIRAFSGSTVTATAPTAGTLIGQWTLTVAAASVSGVLSVADSYVVQQACINAGGVAVTNVTAFDKTTKCSNGQIGVVYVQLKDALGNSITSGTLSATVTAGTVNIVDESSATVIAAGDSYGGTTAFESDTSPLASQIILVTQPVAYTAGSSTLTVSHNGAVVGSKTISWTGDIATLTIDTVSSASAFANAKDESSTTGFIANVVYAAKDAAGNAVTLTSQPSITGATGALVEASIGTTTTSALIAALQTSSVGYGYSTMIIPSNSSLRGAGTYQLKLTNAKGVDIKSNVATVIVSNGATASFTASWDKASYAPGDIATMSITVKDQYGNLMGSGTTLAGLSLAVSTAGFTSVGGTCADTSTVTAGVRTCKFAAGNDAGSYSWSVDLTTSPTNQSAAIGTLEIKASTATVSNADVLKSIVALIASINKQIQALQKLILKR